MMTKMGRQVTEEVNRDKTGEADEMNLKVDYVDELMHIFLAHQPLMMRWLVAGRKTVTRSG